MKSLLFLQIDFTASRQGLRRANAQHDDSQDTQHKPASANPAYQVVRRCSRVGYKLEVQHDGKHDERYGRHDHMAQYFEQPRLLAPVEEWNGETGRHIYDDDGDTDDDTQEVERCARAIHKARPQSTDQGDDQSEDNSDVGRTETINVRQSPWQRHTRPIA